MAGEGLANLFTTSVGAGGIDTVSNQLPVLSAAPSSLAGLNFAIIVSPGNANEEIMEVTANNQTLTWTVTRASEPIGATGAQTAYSHQPNEVIEAVITAGGLHAFINSLAVVQGGAAGGDLAGNFPNPIVGPAASTSGRVAQGLSPTAVKTAAYVANPGEFVPADTSGGNITITLPTAPADKTRIGVKMVVAGGSVTIARGGSDVFNVAGGPTSLTLSMLNQAVNLQYSALAAVWYVQADVRVAGTSGTVTGDGTTTAFPINHNLGKASPYSMIAQFYNRTGTDQESHPTISARSANSFTATFSPAPASGALIDWEVI